MATASETAGVAMTIEQNVISRDWRIVRNGRTFLVNFTESDGQTLALCNRDNWQVLEETEDGDEELCDHVFSDSSPVEKQRAVERTRLKIALMEFCLENWDSVFMQEVRAKLSERAAALEWFVGLPPG